MEDIFDTIRKAKESREYIINSVWKCADSMFRTVVMSDDEFSAENLLKLSGPRAMMEWAYRADVGANRLMPIEKLDDASKWFYWDRAKRLGLSKDESIRAAKGLYYMDHKAEKYNQ